MTDNQSSKDRHREVILNPIEYLGQTLKTTKSQYEVRRFLGEGLTSFVFSAQQLSTGKDVAVKILRSDTSAHSRSSFWEEQNVLNQLRSADVTNVPEILDSNSDGPTEFLVMDLIDSAEFPSLDLILKGKDFLKEPEALEIALQAFKLLHELHTKLERSYTDMQLKNFCWNSSQTRLIVMDWNHVSFRKDIIARGLHEQNPDVLRQLRGRGARNFDELVYFDILRLTSYLYRLLTGKAAKEQGETVWRLKKQAGSQWESISLATRQIILDILIPSSQSQLQPSADEIYHRLVDAKDLLTIEDAESLQNRFDEHFDKARQLPSGARQPELNQAAVLLHRLEQIQDPKITRWVALQKTQLDQIGALHSGDWQAGQNFYEAGSFGEANLYWTKESKRQGDVQTWRWAILAKVCADSLSQLTEEEQKISREALEAGIGNLQIGRLEDAQADFERGQKLLKNHYIDFWLQEIRALDELRSFDLSLRDREPGETARRLQKICRSAFWEELEYTDILITDQTWFAVVTRWFALEQVNEMSSKSSFDLRSSFEKLARTFKKLNETRQQKADFLLTIQNIEFDDFVTELKKALLKDPDDSDVVQAALRYIESSPVEEKLEILEIVTTWSHLEPQLAADVKNEKIKVFEKQFDELLIQGNSFWEQRNISMALTLARSSEFVDQLLNALGVKNPDRHGKLQELNGKISGEQEAEVNRTNEIAQLERVWQIDAALKELQAQFESFSFKLWTLRKDHLSASSTALETLKDEVNRVGKQIDDLPVARRQHRIDLHRRLIFEHDRLHKLIEGIQTKLLPAYEEATRLSEGFVRSYSDLGDKADWSLWELVMEETEKAQEIKSQLKLEFRKDKVIS